MHRPDTLKGRLSKSAKGSVVRQGRFSALTSDTKWYLVHLDKTREVHDKTSVCDKLG